MVKKRTRDPEVLPEAPPVPAKAAGTAGEGRDGADSGSGSDDDLNNVNVDFEWFNFLPAIDFHGVKALLRQLFDVDAQLLDLSALTDLVIAQTTIGSTVKVDGEGTDAYAFLTAVELGGDPSRRKVAAEGKENGKEKGEKNGKAGEALEGLKKYVLEKSAAGVAETLRDNGAKVGLVLGERLINVPAEIAPPMYSMLVDELEAAVEDEEEEYDFTHYLVLSKTYREIESALDGIEESDEPRTKKTRKGKRKGAGGFGSGEMFYFHPEDELLMKYAKAWNSFEYTRDEGEGMADSKRAFQEMGIKAQGLMVLLERERWEEVVKEMGAYLGAPS